MKLKTLLFIVMILGTLVMVLQKDGYPMPERNIIGDLNLAAMPNIETSIGYDFTTKTFPVLLTSKVFVWKFLELRAGGLTDTLSNTLLVSVSMNARKLQKYVSGIEYAWSDYLDLSVGSWYGRDFTLNERRYGIHAVLIKYEFKK